MQFNQCQLMICASSLFSRMTILRFDPFSQLFQPFFSHESDLPKIVIRGYRDVDVCSHNPENIIPRLRFGNL
jgi:hypothetical protein